MALFLDELPRLAASRAPLLIEGEPGCGRAALATVVHGLVAPCADQPLLRVSCVGNRALARVQRVLQRIDQEPCSGCSLLLEEVGGMSMALQQCLLGWLEEHTDTPTPRLLSTSTGLVRARLERGEFRRDLYHRLAVLHVRLPVLLSLEDTAPARPRRSRPRLVLDADSVQRALADADHNLSQAACALGVHRSTLWRALRRLGLAP